MRIQTDLTAIAVTNSEAGKDQSGIMSGSLIKSPCFVAVQQQNMDFFSALVFSCLYDASLIISTFL